MDGHPQSAFSLDGIGKTVGSVIPDVVFHGHAFRVIYKAFSNQYGVFCADF